MVERTCGSELINSELQADHPPGAAKEAPIAEAAVEVSQPCAAYGGALQTPSISRDWCG